MWLALLCFVFCGVVYLKIKIDACLSSPEMLREAALTQEQEKFRGFVGEKIVYDVKLGGVTLGRAVFNHVSRGMLGAREVNFMTFKTSLVRFSDLEKIYSDLDSFLPLKVERDVSTWPNREKITEIYDQDKFTLKITKLKGNKKEELSISKDGPIYNAILLPFHVRMIADLDPSFTMKIRLPTQEFTIKLTGIEEVTVPAGAFKAFHFESEPKKFEIWISADDCRTPLRIKGTGLVGYTLLMREHHLP